MTNARQLIDRTKAHLAEMDGAIRGHRFVVAIEQGQVDRDALHHFCGSQYQMWKTNSTAVSMARFENHPYREVFLTPPEVEAGAAREIALLAQRLGMDSTALEQFEPTAEAFGYAAYKAWLICYGSAAEMACARALNLSAWGYNCGKISHGLQSHYGLTADETHFFDGFSGLRELENKAVTVIDADLQNGINPVMITRAARLMQSYETMYWDAMARQAGL
ncbi:MAG: hypothetical protein NXI27_11350 [Alphaproteobacteria bacterium]|nr:hypothetical protein [Alphaproteobacteria bacterium]